MFYVLLFIISFRRYKMWSTILLLIVLSINRFICFGVCSLTLKEVPVYNFTSGSKRPLTWGQVGEELIFCFYALKFCQSS